MTKSYTFNTQLYVVDTNSIISYFPNVFEQQSKISLKAIKILDEAFDNSNPFILISIPSVVFVEIFDKWIKSEEFAKKFYYEVFLRLKHSEFVEIKEIDKEILEKLVEIGGSLSDHDINDKLVLASAMVLNCSLITSDSDIRTYIEENKVIPAIID